MREPGFWHAPSSWKSHLLRPLAALYGAVAAQRLRRKGFDAGIPVICVGNYHVGGAGKTPTVLALAKVLRELGEIPVVEMSSEGPGGREEGLMPLPLPGGRYLPGLVAQRLGEPGRGGVGGLRPRASTGSATRLVSPGLRWLREGVGQESKGGLGQRGDRFVIVPETGLSILAERRRAGRTTG